MNVVQHVKQAGYRPRGIVHVGAHFGQELLQYSSLCPERVIWIEADPTLMQRLRDNVTKAGDPRHTVLQALISDEDGQVVDFYRFTNSGASSSIFRATELLHQRWPHVRETGEVLRLTTSRLDTLLRSAGIAPTEIDVLVFDVQGAELLALQGAGDYLASARFVEVEVSRESIYEGAPLTPEVDAYLRKSGLAPISNFPWHGSVVYHRTGEELSPEPSPLSVN